VAQAENCPRHRYCSGLVAFRLRDGFPTNRLKRTLIHGTYYTLYTQRRWNPEVADIFGAAARYHRASVSSSYDDAHPDDLALHAGKIFSCPLHISRVVLLLLRQRRSVAAKTWRPQ
jgi:hypothetical protein